MKLDFFEEAFKFHKVKSFTNLSNILNSIDMPVRQEKTNKKNLCEI